MQLELHLVDRLRAEVANIQQVLLAARYQLRDRVNALPLEAVVGPNGQVQILDRQGKIRGQLLIDGRRPDLDAFRLNIELTGQAEQLNQGTPGGGDGVARPDSLLGLD